MAEKVSTVLNHFKNVISFLTRAVVKKRRRFGTVQDVVAQYHDLAEGLPDIIARLDTQARHIYISPQAVNNSMFNECMVLGKTVLESGLTGCRDCDQRLYDAARKAIETGELYRYQDWWRLPEGRRCLEIRHIPEKDHQGNVVSVFWIARDITDQVKTEETLKFVAQRGWSRQGDSFLNSLVRFLGEMLEVNGVVVSRVTSHPDELQTVALFFNGKIFPDQRYNIKGTPCEKVVNEGLCCYSQDVSQIFSAAPLNLEVDVQSYIGLPLWDASGQLGGLLMILDSEPMTDTSGAISILQLVAIRTAVELARERWERKLQTREEQYRRVFENSPDAIIRYDKSCRRTYGNPAHAKSLLVPVSLGTKPIDQWGLGKDRNMGISYQAHLQTILDTGEPHQWEISCQDHDKEKTFWMRGTPEFDEDGEVVGVIVFGRDVSERKQLEMATVARAQEFRALVENSPDFVTRFDSDCRRTYLNPSLARVLEHSPDNSLLGKTPTECYPDNEQSVDYEARIRYVLMSGESVQFVFNFTNDSGRQYHYEIRIVPERDAEGTTVSALAIGRDIGDRLSLEDKLRHQASYDALTGLPNRWLLGERLQEEIARAQRSDGKVALLFIDLDRFKEVNDTLGHEQGDALLCEATRRIRSHVRRSDIVGRWGGDEFVIVLSGITDSMHLSSMAQNIIDTLSQPFMLNEHIAYISASIGIANYPSDADCAEVLLSCADQAMYAAKEHGRRGFSYFTASMQEEVESRLCMANDLRSALEKKQLYLEYQPIIDIANNKTIKAEALIRWRHPDYGMVRPDKFIPIAEETGMIHEIGNKVFFDAVKMAAEWYQLQNNEPVQVSVNISPRQFLHDQSVETWLSYIEASGIPGECIAIEITEGLLLDDQEQIKQKLDKLRGAGIHIALDDFGTGYSAMAYLKKFNIDYLKIDSSFVHDLAIDENDRAIAETIVIMARRLGMKTIAEGVETIEQRDILAAVGCHYVQGYLYARPMKEEAFWRYVSETKQDLQDVATN